MTADGALPSLQVAECVPSGNNVQIGLGRFWHVRKIHTSAAVQFCFGCLRQGQQSSDLGSKILPTASVHLFYRGHGVASWTYDSTKLL